MIWNRKNEDIKKKSMFFLKNAYNHDYNFKVNQILFNLKKKHADYQFITSSENNAWLLNIRGNDTKYSPIPNCYILIDNKKNIIFFCDLKKISKKFRKKFNKVNFIDMSLVKKTLLKINNKKFIIDRNSCSLYFEQLISINNKILNFNDPIYFLKQ